ncbi:MAG TPA: methyltransferase domain-containing protein [Solirubrobacterales bacterium]|nr:methyltransferase domain-containing protein [Solirubrobacterales bacterium]
MATVTGDAKTAYEAFAPVYDIFTAHYDDELWIGELVSALERNGLSGDRLLDVACGTGRSFLPMLKRGWNVTACDISPAMLERARAKVGEAVQLSVADMRDFPEIGKFDLVWALDDSINYLLSEEELLEALTGMKANLAPGGLLLFDVNTLVAYRSFFAETVVVERDGRRFVWRGQAARDAEPGSICEAILEEDGGPTTTHQHRQRHFARAEIGSAVERAGLSLVDTYGLYTDGTLRQPLDENAHTKAVYIADAEGGEHR